MSGRHAITLAASVLPRDSPDPLRPEEAPALAIDRRTFLAGAALTAASVCSPLAALRAARAIEPIRRNGKSKFKLSMAAYSYHSLLTAKPPKVTVEDFIADCAALNLDGIELTSYYLPQKPSPQQLNHLKNTAFLAGLDISGTAVGNHFCHRPGPERQEQIDHVKRWIGYAERLSAPVIRIFAGDPGKLPPAEAHKLVVSAIEECCQFAGEHGIMLALENHGGLTARVEDTLDLVRDVRSPWFGVNLDTGNFHTEDLYGDLAKLAPYAVNVQVKVSVSGPDGKRRPSDLHKLADIFRDAGYRGYIVLEFEEKEDPRVGCAKRIAALREAFDRHS